MTMKEARYPCSLWCLHLSVFQGVCTSFPRLSVFASMDDKHRVKIGEPSCPVAAAERGRQVIEVGQAFKYQITISLVSALFHWLPCLWIFQMPYQDFGTMGMSMFYSRIVHLEHHHPSVMPQSLQPCSGVKHDLCCSSIVMGVQTTC